ncbi:MAG TPA: hypothetical protein VGR02_07935 [Thermoanaerobaculia bacterium]|jgi:hypothetical protein|nr:hypothetical protein [Thermoanaerobaculia bacterium]
MTWSTVYLVCFLCGFGLSVISFVSGLDRVDFFDHIFGLARGHGFGHGHGHALGHGHGGHAQAHGHGAKAAGKNMVRATPVQQQDAAPHVSALNMTALTAFVTWFGAGGFVLQRTTSLPDLVITAGAVGTGFVGGSLINRFMRMLVRGERRAQRLTWQGTLANVTMPIRKGGTGEIVFTHDGTRQVAGARADNGEAIDKGTEVIVTRYDKGIAYVCTWDELEAITPQS